MDHLTPSNIRESSAPNPLLPDPHRQTIVDRYYFERVVSITNDHIPRTVPPGIYGPFPLLSPPANVVRSIVQGVAVCGSPSAYFRSRFWWTFLISDGTAQEFIAETITGMSDTSGGGHVTSGTLVPGIRFSPVGYLDDLEPASILVKQGAQLQIQFSGGNVDIDRDFPNATIRLHGVYEFARPQ